MPEPRIGAIDSAEQTTMRFDRGITKHLAGLADGAEKVDVHINVINADSGVGPYHYHAVAENVYIVLEGAVEAIVDGVRHVLRAGDTAFIPPGVPHAAGSDGTGPATVIEIYAPAGRDFHIIEDSDDVIAKARAEYQEA